MKFSNFFMLFPYLPIVIGALLGAALGYYGQCSSGTCPLTSTWWRGAIYGAVLGTIFFLSSRSRAGASTSDRQKKEQPAASVKTINP